MNNVFKFLGQTIENRPVFGDMISIVHNVHTVFHNVHSECLLCTLWKNSLDYGDIYVYAGRKLVQEGSFGPY